MTWPLYYAAVALASAGARVVAWWNPKVRAFISGRIGWKQKINSFPSKTAPRIWFHVSSLGEFEQAKPVIEKLQSAGRYDIVLTFFSPSGFEVRKNYEHARVMYLPLDLPGNAMHWMKSVQPDFAVFVKYDFWPGYLYQLVKQSIPFIVIAAHFNPGKQFSSWSIPPANALLKKSNMIFLQNKDHVAELRALGFSQIMIAGDTRIDRVTSLPEEAALRLPDIVKAMPPFDLIAGSTWPEDERILLEVIEKMQLRAIIAPHDVSPANIDRLAKQLPKDHVRFSQIRPGQTPRVMLIDNIGLLAYLYSLGRIAYIGGGFGKNIHNILEPMAHGKPVIIGPGYHHFPEAVSMIKEGGAFTIAEAKELSDVVRHLTGETGSRAGSIASAYIRAHTGATEIITRYIAESIPFASNS